MIQVREGQFETNSSSTHVFCCSNSGGLKIPKEIKLSTLCNCDYLTYGQNPTTDKLAFMYYMACEYGKGDLFIAYLESKGITVLRDVEYSFADRMFGFDISEKDLNNFLFNDESEYFLDSDYDYDNITKIRNLEDKGFTIKEFRE